MFCVHVENESLTDQLIQIDLVIVQQDERNLFGRSVRLDALCTFSDGSKCNVEVQRADGDDHFRRVRFNASSITVMESQTGDRFEQVLELYMVYISEKDIAGLGKTIYHVDKTVRETGDVIDDGLHEIYVNAEIDDGTDISRLMKCFMQDIVNSPEFPALSSRVRELNETEGGLNAVCSVMEHYERIAAEKAAAEAKAEADRQNHIRVFKDALDMGIPREKAIVLSQITEEELRTIVL